MEKLPTCLPCMLRGELCGSEREIFFIRKAECSAISGRLNVDMLNFVLTA